MELPLDCQTETKKALDTLDVGLLIHDIIMSDQRGELDFSIYHAPLSYLEPLGKSALSD